MYRKLALEISRGLRQFLDEKIYSVPEDFCDLPPENFSEPDVKIHICREFYADGKIAPEILSAEAEYQRKIQEGLDLFAQYFRDLFN